MRVVYQWGTQPIYAPVGVTFEAAQPKGTDLQFSTSPALDVPVTPGTTIDLTSVDPCPGHRTGRSGIWVLAPVGAEGQPLAALDSGDLSLEPDGSWTASAAAPTTEGIYALFAGCIRPDVLDPEGFTITGIYPGFYLAVDAAGGGTPTPPPGSPPVTPGDISAPGGAPIAPPATATPQGNRRITG